jgi:hypothetical protein
MKNGRTLGRSGRCTQLEPVIRRSFDIASMARLSVGPSWAGLTEAQRQQITESFGSYISANYADRFDSYNGQKLEVLLCRHCARGRMAAQEQPSQRHFQCRSVKLASPSKKQIRRMFASSLPAVQRPPPRSW